MAKLKLQSTYNTIYYQNVPIWMRAKTFLIDFCKNEIIWHNETKCLKKGKLQKTSFEKKIEGHCSNINADNYINNK